MTTIDITLTKERLRRRLTEARQAKAGHQPPWPVFRPKDLVAALKAVEALEEMVLALDKLDELEAAAMKPNHSEESNDVQS